MESELKDYIGARRFEKKYGTILAIISSIIVVAVLTTIYLLSN